MRDAILPVNKTKTVGSGVVPTSQVFIMIKQSSFIRDIFGMPQTIWHIHSRTSWRMDDLLIQAELFMPKRKIR